LISDSPSDRALVNRIVAARDEQAFRELYRRHTPALFRIAARLGPCTDAAEDLVQETWIRAVDRLARFEWRSRLETWLVGILLNRIREARRADARAAPSPLDLHSLPAALVSIDERLDLASAVAELPEGYRSLIVLHDIEGYSHEEIADLLGIAVGTSKSQLSRARRALRRWLEPGETPV
jgi:RNA polymerase sigma-70 factor, ECF subfamily